MAGFKAVNRFLAITISILTLFVLGQASLSNWRTKLTAERFEKEILYQYELIWEEFLNRQKLLMEQQIPAITRDRQLANSIEQKDQEVLQQTIQPTFNRLSALEIVDQLQVFDEQGQKLWAAAEVSQSIASEQLAATSIAKKGIVSGIGVTLAGRVMFTYAFPIFQRGKVIGVVAYSKDLAQVLSNLEGEAKTKIVLTLVDKRPVVGMPESYSDLLNVISQQSTQLIEEVVLNGADYQLAHLPLVGFSGERLGSIVFARDVSVERAAYHRSLKALVLFAVMLILVTLSLLYYFIVRENETLLALEAEKNQQLAKANTLMKEANESKSNFLSNVSHELRTPLNGIKSLADLLLVGRLDSEQRNDVETMLKCVKDLEGIVNSVLNFNKISTNEFSVQSVPFSPRQLLSDQLESSELLSNETDLIAALEVSPTVPETVVGDPDLICNLVTSLVSNALKFAKRPGAVVVYMELVESKGGANKLHAVVANTGSSVTPGKEEEIFALFNQENNSVTREYGGVGLGLAMCRAITTALNGRIWVESSEKIGSAFHFEVEVSLPEQQTETEVSPNEVTVETTKAPSGPLRVLLVEDFAPDRRSISKLLAKQGLEVFVASNGLEALARLESESYDLILMDIHMPDTNGVELAKKILESRVDKTSIPIVAVTSDPCQSLREQCMSAGMFSYVSKPLNTGNLLDILSSLNRS